MHRDKPKPTLLQPDRRLPTSSFEQCAFLKKALNCRRLDPGGHSGLRFLRQAVKIREGGMPPEDMWKSYYDPGYILRELELTRDCKEVVDFGCGYGTFTIPAARIVTGSVYAIDIEAELVRECRNKAKTAGLRNVTCQKRDFISNGTGLPQSSMDYAMLFNILHTENPLALLQEARRILAPFGKVGVIHWNYDPSTPRGPSMEIRPRPEQCREWMKTAGFDLVKPFVDLPPYHYGILGRKA